MKLSEFLQTLTGSSRVPPLGFPGKIKVEWFDKAENECRYPRISTCNLSIELPRGFSDTDVFENYMNEAIIGSRNYFGHV